MSPLAAAALAALAAGAVPGRPAPRARGRLAGVRAVPPTRIPGAGGAKASRPTRTGAGRWAAGALAAVSVASLLGSPAGPVVGLALVLGLPRALARLPDRAELNRRAAFTRDLPLALDLLAAALRAGSPLPAATRAVSLAVPGPAGERLARVAAELALGAEPARAWAAAGDEAELRRLARAAVRVAASGAALADVLAELAGELRTSEHDRIAAAGRRAGVWAVLPVGLCFLPAFVLVGVVPVVAGLLPGLLPAGGR